MSETDPRPTRETAKGDLGHACGSSQPGPPNPAVTVTARAPDRTNRTESPAAADQAANPRFRQVVPSSVAVALRYLPRREPPRGARRCDVQVLQGGRRRGSRGPAEEAAAAAVDVSSERARATATGMVSASAVPCTDEARRGRGFRLDARRRLHVRVTRASS